MIALAHAATPGAGLILSSRPGGGSSLPTLASMAGVTAC
ncbi:MAG: hypothetical protein AVDCRST_MAG33-2068 [uncultured Thermomicrobiales bacterium]|uniref:Uncharacterized protein n=1 Tax=uncultured Thermomicrobiales bacterium TaxID=1645740 RepID=A0A6J4V0Q5_9BACT|nr:MAG: hypothetical protein AVDCRST_MAG33-2068 [uncultured Thermomicrobiales bacterium]